MIGTPTADGGGSRLLRRIGLSVTVAYAVLTALLVAGEAVTDPGGWRAAGLIASWAVPLAVLAMAAWYRPRLAAPALAAATAVIVGLAVWYAIAPVAWRTFENHTGPVRALVTFIVAVPLGLLGRHRPAAAGLLLLVVGAAPVVLADLAGLAPIFAVTSVSAAGAPPILIGILYLLSAVPASPARPVDAGQPASSITVRR